jgi:hypothetical protein
MIDELRTYHLTSVPMLAHMHRRMEQHLLPLFNDLDIHVAGVWEGYVGSGLPTFTWLVRWRDLMHRQVSWDAFQSDPRWAEIRQRTTEAAGGEIVGSMDVSLLKPAAYWPPGLP